HHACCTNPMGADDGPTRTNNTNAVLDGNFKVRGVDNLWVVDTNLWLKVPA
ncbi:hypothetical protein B0H14DRAFT_2358449, partial [Mycena olivaceomarginata]